jgi:hypothetical protein
MLLRNFGIYRQTQCFFQLTRIKINQPIYDTTHHQVSLGNQIKGKEVGGARGTHGTGDKRVQGFGGKARSKKATWKTKA